MKKVSICQIDSFTTVPFTGNPAGVVENNDLSDKEMQLIAKEMNLSETSFLITFESSDYKLRWFTPIKEVDFCGHGTLAALHYLKESHDINDNSEVSFETRSGVLKCCIEKNFYYVQIPPFSLSIYNEFRSELLASIFGITEKDVEGDFLILSSGDIYIRVKSIYTLGKIRPDFKRLNELALKSKIHGAALYTLETIETDSTAHLRYFSPYDGIDEDPATGAANGPLIKILTDKGIVANTGDTVVQFEQGDFLGRPGRIKVLRRNNEIFVGGNAVTVLKGEIYI